MILSQMLAITRTGLIFDIGSLKAPFKETLKQMTEKGMQVASIHPMFGPNTDLLSGKHIIFMEVGSDQSLEIVQKLFESTMSQQI